MNGWFKRTQAAPLKPPLGDGMSVELTDLLACQSLGQLLSLRADPKKVSSRHGQYLSRMKGRGMEFSEVRAYQQGDDIRAIDWRVTARTGKTHTRLYEEERERPVFIFLDLSASMSFGSSLYLKSTQACYLAAALAWSAFSGGDRIGLVCLTPHGTVELPALPRRRGLTQVLEAIEKCHQQLLSNRVPTANLNFTGTLDHLRRHVHTGALLCLVSDFQALTPQAEQSLTLLRRHNQLLCFQVEDPLEQQLAQRCQADLGITNGQQEGLLALSSQSTRADYNLQVEQHQRYCQQTLAKLSQHHSKVSAALPLQQQLQGDRV